MSNNLFFQIESLDKAAAQCAEQLGGIDFVM
jgi:hypothetical protein